MYLYMYALHFVYICIHGYVYARIFTVSNYPLLSSLPATESSPILTIHERSSWVFPKFQNLAWLIIILDDIKIYSQSFRTLVGFRFGLAPANRWWQGDAAALALRLQQLLAEREEVAGTAGTMADLGRWVVSLPSYDLWGPRCSELIGYLTIFLFLGGFILYDHIWSI